MRSVKSFRCRANAFYVLSAKREIVDKMQYKVLKFAIYTPCERFFITIAHVSLGKHDEIFLRASMYDPRIYAVLRYISVVRHHAAIL